MTHCWKIKPGQGLDSLIMTKADGRILGHGEVRLAIKAVSLNARDLMVALGNSPLPTGEEIIPCSDGSGIVEEIGPGVNRVAKGDRVVVTFNPAHQNGPFESYMGAHALGELRDGILTKTAVFDQMALVKLPSDLSFEQAACLPCIGVTSWSAMFEIGRGKPGQTVLAIGTGALSLTALQLAKAAGMRFGISSSNQQKLARAQAMGADFTVNYRERPKWDEAVREATSGIGAHIILENAGPPSVATSIRAAARDGYVVQIGWKGMVGPPVSAIDIALGGVTLAPVMVGSRVMLERVVAAVAVNAIQIPIHRQFDFDQAPQAFHMLASGQTFGKIIITT